MVLNEPLTRAVLTKGSQRKRGNLCESPVTSVGAVAVVGACAANPALANDVVLDIGSYCALRFLFLVGDCLWRCVFCRVGDFDGDCDRLNVDPDAFGCRYNDVGASRSFLFFFELRPRPRMVFKNDMQCAWV